jgi:hypothetical protein
VLSQEYSAALQQILPPDYVTGSHHVRWESAFQAAIQACDKSLSVEEPNPSGVEVNGLLITLFVL